MKEFEKSPDSLSADGTGNHEVRLECSQKEALKVWLAAWVRLFHEQKTGEILTKNGIENFVPVQKEYHQWSDRIKRINHVVIPRIVFVHVSPIERKQVLEMPSVIKFMVECGEHRPAIIPEKQMTNFKFMLDSSDDAVSVVDRPIMKGEKVKIIRGPLADLEGGLITINSQKEVGVYLNALGYAYVNVPIKNIVCVR